MTTTKPSRRSSRYRLALAGGLAVFITLAGTGIANAGWTAPVVNAPASATAGTIGINQSGFGSLAVQFSSSVLAKTAPITVTNTGTIPAPYTLTLGAAVVNALTPKVTVNTWPVASAANCLPGSAVPGTASNSKWNTVPALGGSLGAGAAAVWCVRASMTAAQANPNPGESMTATLALTSNVGSWTSSVNATAFQSVLDTVAPTTPTNLAASATTNTQTTLTWTASTDFVGVTGYLVYRGPTLVATIATTTFTDTGLLPLSSNVYTIKARDAAGNISAASAPTTVKTLMADPARWYTVTNSAGLCVDGTGLQGDDLKFLSCVDGNQNQHWKFVETTAPTVSDISGIYKIVRRAPTSWVWNVSRKGNNVPVSLGAGTDTTTSEWQWRPEYISGIFRFRWPSNGNYLLGLNSPLTVGGGTGGEFTLTVVP